MQQNKLGSHPESKKVTALTIISAVIIVLAVAMTSLAAYFWQQERHTADVLRERVSELEDATPASNSDNSSAALCSNSTTQFTPSVGKFSLSLPDSNYIIIKNHDGAGEGGDSSRVSVGKCLNTDNNTIEYNTREEVVLQATPATNWSDVTFEDWAAERAAADGGEARNLDNGTIGEIATREFTVEGLGETRKTYFENNGIWYELTTYDATEGSPALTTRTAVINGLSFTE